MKLKILVHGVNIIKNILHYSWNNAHSIWVMKLPLNRKRYNTTKNSYSIQHYKQYSNTKHLVQVNRQNADKYDALTLLSTVNHPFSPSTPQKWKEGPQNSPKLLQVKTCYWYYSCFSHTATGGWKSPTLIAILSPKKNNGESKCGKKTRRHLISTKQRLLWWKDMTVTERIILTFLTSIVCVFPDDVCP